VCVGHLGFRLTDPTLRQLDCPLHRRDGGVAVLRPSIGSGVQANSVCVSASTRSWRARITNSVPTSRNATSSYAPLSIADDHHAARPGHEQFAAPSAWRSASADSLFYRAGTPNEKVRARFG
jgi:hypothetical protein